MIIMRCSFPRLLTKFVANYKSKVALVVEITHFFLGESFNY